MNKLWQTWVQLNQKYDRLKEPKRFFVFMIPMAVLILIITLLKTYAIEFNSVDAAVGAITLFFVLAAIGLARYFYVKRM